MIKTPRARKGYTFEEHVAKVPGTFDFCALIDWQIQFWTQMHADFRR